MNVLIPTPITDTVLTSSTLAEDATAAWTSGTYVVGDERHVVATHRVYRCAVAGSSTVTPQSDPTRWVDMRPTNKWAPFDLYTTTAATGTTSFSYTLLPGFINALSAYGLVGSDFVATLKDAPGGTVLATRTVSLYAQALGLYELAFVPLRQVDRVAITDLPLAPGGELTVTVNGGSGNPVALGMLNVGDYRPVIGAAAWGGTEHGAAAEPKSFSYINTLEDGTVQIKRRGAATDLSGTVAMPAEQAEYAAATVRQVLDVPVSCIASNRAGYAYLNTFGLISGRVVAESAGVARFQFSVKGFI